MFGEEKRVEKSDARVVLLTGSVAKNQTTPVGNSKRLRLFGVNLECQMDESEPSTPDGSSLSSQGPVHHQFYPQAYSSNAYNHMVRPDFCPTTTTTTTTTIIIIIITQFAITGEKGGDRKQEGWGGGHGLKKKRVTVGIS